VIVIVILSLTTLAVVVSVVQSITQRERRRHTAHRCVYCRTKLTDPPAQFIGSPVCSTCGRSQPATRMNQR
jgi:hypothetical protein